MMWLKLLSAVLSSLLVCFCTLQPRVGSFGKVRIYSVSELGRVSPAVNGMVDVRMASDVAQFTPDGKYLTVLNQNDSKATVYSVSDSGALRKLRATPFSMGDGSQPAGIAYYTYPNNRTIAAVTDSGNHAVLFFNQKNGRLRPMVESTLNTGIMPINTTFSHDGRFLSVINYGDGTLSMFRRTSLSPLRFTPVDGSPFFIGESADFVSVAAFSPNDKFLAITLGNPVLGQEGNVFMFSVAKKTGALTPVAQSPFRVQKSPSDVLFSPDGKYLLVSNLNSSSVLVFSVGTNGNLMPVSESPFATEEPTGLTFTSDGKYVVINNSFAKKISICAFNSVIGKLVPSRPPTRAVSTWGFLPTVVASPKNNLVAVCVHTGPV